MPPIDPHPVHPLPEGWLAPRFSNPAVRAVMTSRQGGSSGGPWASMNLGAHVGDDPAHVADNRARLERHVGAPAIYLEQVHGVAVLAARPQHVQAAPVRADAACTRSPGLALTAQVADCLPVLFASVPTHSPGGAGIAAAHAGWRGLCQGVLEATVQALCGETGAAPGTLEVWLGPCIGPTRFEVGDEVRAAFVQVDAQAESAFEAGSRAGHWWADLRQLARQRLVGAGVPAARIQASDACTASDADRYFSFRRDGTTGRMAAAIALLPSDGRAPPV